MIRAGFSPQAARDLEGVFRNYLVFYLPLQENIIVVRGLHAAQDWTRFFTAAQNPPT